MDRKTKKIFIQRDYSRGTAVRFATEFPRELTGKVDSLFLYINLTFTVV